VSIAVQHKGVTQHGVIYDPVKDEMFSASRGQGALLRDVSGTQRRIRMTPKDTLQDTFMAVGYPYAAMRNGEVVSYAEQHFNTLLAVTKAGAQIRRGGSAALDLAYVAAGRFDAYFELGLKPWDLAAGELIVREAGGVVVDAKGGQDSLSNGQIIATSMKLLKPLMQTIVPTWGDAIK
jgi:myo-inositol-1(or 4)-monophosphatase